MASYSREQAPLAYTAGVGVRQTQESGAETLRKISTR
jgi:hypothetical protein